jgi:hypothetical protein
VSRSNFHVLRSLTRFGRYRGHLVQFSCFTRPDSFSAVPRVPGPVFMFCPRRLIFGGTIGAGSSFHVLRSQTLFSRYVLVFTFYAPGLVLVGIEGAGSSFHVLRS